MALRTDDSLSRPSDCSEHRTNSASMEEMIARLLLAPSSRAT
jgi:hypothetical protein